MPLSRLRERVARALGAGQVRVICAVICTTSLATAAPAQTPPPPAERGATPETAIVLPGISDEFHGVVAEQAFIAAHFPTWHIEYQTRLTRNDRDYDVLGMIKPDKTKLPIFFDITPWVGK